jgi:hypothetical protein
VSVLASAVDDGADGTSIVAATESLKPAGPTFVRRIGEALDDSFPIDGPSAAAVDRDWLATPAVVPASARPSTGCSLATAPTVAATGASLRPPVNSAA